MLGEPMASMEVARRANPMALSPHQKDIRAMEKMKYRSRRGKVS
jgi:hypothetical protein